MTYICPFQKEELKWTWYPLTIEREACNYIWLKYGFVLQQNLPPIWSQVGRSQILILLFDFFMW